MPQWNRTIYLAGAVRRYKDRVNTIPELATEVVGIIERSGWLADTPFPDTLRDHLNQLKQAESEGEYRDAFEYIYDVADQDRVWIETS